MILFHFFRNPRDRAKRGAALLIVLSVLMLIMVLAVGFIITAGNERLLAHHYKTDINTLQLAETALNLVQAQIHQATSGLGSENTWASQPGMIRTFKGSAEATGFYKLYSSPQMIAKKFNLSDINTEIPNDWKDRPREFTDLNEPVETMDGAKRYPILDPQAQGVVEGFSVGTVPGGSSANSLPMPVQWLYVQADGQIRSFSEATFTTDNPVVGRIAFWTDDETSKININTASVGTYWDTPRAFTTEEMNLGSFQPIQNEFQRYPGHPAMTSLMPVFGSVLKKPSSYYAISPRVADGGSQGGTVAGSMNQGGLPLKKDRLYSTVEEILFDPSRKIQGLSREDVERAKFFITTSSRAPDVNLYNRPRVSLWPIHQHNTSTYRTPLDNLIAFCSTVGERSYFFQRANSQSATQDIQISRNTDLLQYLRTLTAADVPGFGGNFLNKYKADRDQILTEIFDYIRSTNILDASTSGLTPYAVGLNANGTPTSGTAAYSNAGAGQVVPSYDATTDTRGFGRFPTVTELAIVFMVTDTNATNPAVPANNYRVQAFLVPGLFTATQGYPPITHCWYLTMTGLSGLQVNNLAIFPNATANILVRKQNSSYNAYSGGGSEGLSLLLSGRDTTAASSGSTNKYPFVSNLFNVDITTGQMAFSGGSITVTFMDPTQSTTLQSLTFNFTPVSIPVPTANSTVSGINFAKLSSSITTIPPDPIPSPGRFYGSAATTAAGKVAVSYLTSHDTVRSVVAGGTSGSDFRMIAAQKTVPSTFFQPSANYNNVATAVEHSLSGASYNYYGATYGRFVPNATYRNSWTGAAAPPLTINDPYQSYGGLGSGQVVSSWYPNLPSSVNGVTIGNIPGDWDTGIAAMRDGAYINKADEGTIFGMNTSSIPYFGSATSYLGLTSTYFSQNRMVPSAGMLGSLSSGVKTGVSWRTLLFRPEPAAHFGNTMSPRDHLWMDLFHLPVVEPYAISEPLSTAGRINMNYQIMPFHYIVRETGMRGVLAAEKMMTIPTADAAIYKGGVTNKNLYRHFINIDETLNGFRQKFATGDIFRSATQICEISLVPNFGGATYAGMSSFWNNYALTGDNIRERPYANIYSQLTTKSNTYTVHFRVQSLKTISKEALRRNGEKILIIGEKRGSAMIERYVDPNDPNLKTIDFAKAPLSDTEADINKYYHFRTLDWRLFDP